MPDNPKTIELSLDDLREVARFAVACARPALAIFETVRPDDPRPRAAIDAAQAFADGQPRTKRLRDCAWDAQRASHDVRAISALAPFHALGASEAARAALAAAGAAFLHPLYKATQVKHILASAAHAARALELAHNDPTPALNHLTHAQSLATPTLRQILAKYPPTPPKGGRVGELMRMLDGRLR